MNLHHLLVLVAAFSPTICFSKAIADREQVIECVSVVIVHEIYITKLVEDGLVQPSQLEPLRKRGNAILAAAEKALLPEKYTEYAPEVAKVSVDLLQVLTQQTTESELEEKLAEMGNKFRECDRIVEAYENRK